VAVALVVALGWTGALIATVYSAAVLLYVLSRPTDWTPHLSRRGLVALSLVGTVAGAFAFGTFLWLLLVHRG